MPYSSDPADPGTFAEGFDRFYTRFARAYAVGVRIFPPWRRWLSTVLPYVTGPRVLEVSFGTGWLLCRCAERFETHGIDYNAEMVQVAAEAVGRAGLRAHIVRADVAHLPYPDKTFDTLVNTMSFTGYPDADASLAEMLRVLRPDGKLVMVDVGFPRNKNPIGMSLTRLWQRTGDLVRDMGALFDAAGCDHRELEVGGFGSIHLHVVQPPE